MGKIRVLSLFSGIGAYESALERLGLDFELVRYCEIDKWASLAYSKIHGVSEELNLGDISKVETKDIPDYDLQTWGFPCTDISLAGKQKGFIDDEGNTTRSGLYYEGLRILKDKRPSYSIIENVKNLVGKKFRGEFDQILRDLGELGYNNYWKVLNAKECTDIPQNRERVFIVSIRKDVDNGIFDFPVGEPCKRRLKDMLETDVEDKYYLDQERVEKIKNWKSFQNPLDRVLGKNSDCPTLTARGAGEWHSGMIILSEDLEETTNLKEEPFIVAQRGRPNEDGKLEQTFEPREDGFANALTTIYKDNLVSEPNIQVVASLRGTGKPWDSRHESICRVYGTEGVAPTITAGGGGGTEVKILEDGDTNKIMCVAQASTGNSQANKVYSTDGVFPTICACTHGYASGYLAEVEPVVCEQRSDEGLRFFKDGAIGTLRTIDACGDKRVIRNRRIRKLTPKEAYLLMGFLSSDYEKVRPYLSDSQLYKTAGNSIVVDVLMLFMAQLFK